jgi:hypothetical protein
MIITYNYHKNQNILRTQINYNIMQDNLCYYKLIHYHYNKNLHKNCIVNCIFLRGLSWRRLCCILRKILLQ